MPISPTPTPPGLTSPSIMWTIGHIPPIGVKLSCMQLTEPFDVPVVDAAHSPHVAGPKRTSLPSMLPPTSSRRRALVDAERRSGRGLPEPSATIVNTLNGQPDAGHHGEQDAGLLLRADQDAVGDDEGERDDEDRPRLDEVGERRSGSRTGAPSWC